jgi:hypothetical protein
MQPNGEILKRKKFFLFSLFGTTSACLDQDSQSGSADRFISGSETLNKIGTVPLANSPTISTKTLRKKMFLLASRKLLMERAGSGSGSVIYSSVRILGSVPYASLETKVEFSASL